MSVDIVKVTIEREIPIELMETLLNDSYIKTVYNYGICNYKKSCLWFMVVTVDGAKYNCYIDLLQTLGHYDKKDIKKWGKLTNHPKMIIDYR